MFLDKGDKLAVLSILKTELSSFLNNETGELFLRGLVSIDKMLPGSIAVDVGDTGYSYMSLNSSSRGVILPVGNRFENLFLSSKNMGLVILSFKKLN